jgi:hypothetical protein
LPQETATDLGGRKGETPHLGRNGPAILRANRGDGLPHAKTLVPAGDSRVVRYVVPLEPRVRSNISRAMALSRPSSPPTPNLRFSRKNRSGNTH